MLLNQHTEITISMVADFHERGCPYELGNTQTLFENLGLKILFRDKFSF